MDENITKVKRGRGRPAEQPWQQWTNGEVWSLRAEVDYQVSTRAKQQQLAKYAKRHRLQVETWTSNDPDLGALLNFQFELPTATLTSAPTPTPLLEDDEDIPFDDPHYGW